MLSVHRQIASLLIAVILAMVGYTYVVLQVTNQASRNAQRAAQVAAGGVTKRITDAIVRSQISGCDATTTRTVQQLKIDWVIYTSDLASSRAPGTGSTQRRIRATEAAGLLAGIQAIAVVHVDASAARMLPAPLATIVTRIGFRCSAQYGLEPGPPPA